MLPPEQLDVLCEHEEFRGALEAWLANGAISWNRWQAGLVAIRKRYQGSDPEATPEGVGYSTWSQQLWSELSEKVLGPDWRQKLKEGRVLPRLPQSGAPSVDTALPGLTTGRMLPTTAKAGGAPMVPTSSWKSEIWGLLERGTKALGASDAKRVARLEASSALGDMLRLPLPEFSIFTPRAKKAETITFHG